MKATVTVSAIMLFTILSSCDDMMCDQLSGEKLSMYDSAARMYDDEAIIEHIPCESNYINIYLKKEDCSATDLNLLHRILFDSVNKTGWPTILVFDNKRQYLYSHSHTGKVYIQSGD